jgi:hypothetical protein
MRQDDGFSTGEPPAPAVIRVVDRRLTLAARVALYAVAALSIASLIATWNEISAFDEFRSSGTSASITAVGRAEDVSEDFQTLVLIVGFATAMLTLAWWNRSYRAIQASGALGLRWSPVWAVAGWFIPIGNLIIEKMVLDEIDRVSAAVTTGERSWSTRPLSVITGWWWAAWIIGLVVGVFGTTVVSAQIEAPTFDPSSYRRGLVALALARALSTAAAFLGAASLRVLGERLDRR